MTGPLLAIEKLEVVYHRAITAVQGITLGVEPGRIVVLLGTNGAGKTTTLRAISGLLPVAAGTITFRGRPIANAASRDILSLGLAHCPEGRRVFPRLTVRENLAMGAYLRRDRTDPVRLVRGRAAEGAARGARLQSRPHVDWAARQRHVGLRHGADLRLRPAALRSAPLGLSPHATPAARNPFGRPSSTSVACAGASIQREPKNPFTRCPPPPGGRTSG